MNENKDDREQTLTTSELQAQYLTLDLHRMLGINHFYDRVSFPLYCAQSNKCV